MKPIIALENIRSAYNVWNIIRTADWLWFDVVLLWYSPSPKDNEKVLKTSLGAENNVNLKHFYNVKSWINYLKKVSDTLIWAELTDKAIPINQLKNKIWEKNYSIIMWNEVEGISLETIEQLDIVSYIPMKWIKNSLNVCEAAAIFMGYLSLN